MQNILHEHVQTVRDIFSAVNATTLILYVNELFAVEVEKGRIS